MKIKQLEKESIESLKIKLRYQKDRILLFGALVLVSIWGIIKLCCTNCG